MEKEKVNNIIYGTEVFNILTGEIGKVVWIGSLVAKKRSPMVIEIVDDNETYQMWFSNQVEIV